MIQQDPFRWLMYLRRTFRRPPVCLL